MSLSRKTTSSKQPLTWRTRCSCITTQSPSGEGLATLMAFVSDALFIFRRWPRVSERFFFPCRQRGPLLWQAPCCRCEWLAKTSFPRQRTGHLSGCSITWALRGRRAFLDEVPALLLRIQIQLPATFHNHIVDDSC